MKKAHKPILTEQSHSVIGLSALILFLLFIALFMSETGVTVIGG